MAFNVSGDRSSLIFQRIDKAFFPPLQNCPVSSSPFTAGSSTLISSLRLITFSKTHLLEPSSKIINILFILVTILVATSFLVYWTTWLVFAAESASQSAVKSPPTIPYIIPFVGHAFYLAYSPSGCTNWARQIIGSGTACGVKILNHTLYILYGPENIAAIWKYKTSITSPVAHAFFLSNVFGLSSKAVEMYKLDNSGILPKQNSYGKVAPHNRIDYQTHAGFQRQFVGKGLLALHERWSNNLANRLDGLDINEEWMEASNMMEFWMTLMTSSLNEAMAGPILECVNPNFTRDLLEFMSCVQNLMKGFPSWCTPKASFLRDRLRRDVKQWHAIARLRFRESDVEEDGYDPWWGSASMRERQKFLGAVDHWDFDAIASADFGLFWGSNINVHPTAIWMIIEVFRDKNLLARVRDEIQAANLTEMTFRDKTERHLSLPLLQSIYAETLRLRVELQSLFYSEHEEIQINEWRFPRKSVIIAPVGPAHRDPNFWNTKNGAEPLDKFWADRFLIYPNDAQGGPRKPKTTTTTPLRPSFTNNNTLPLDNNNPDNNNTTNTNAKPIPKFVSSGLANSYMPFGVGERVCPGRFFAKREVLGFCVAMVNEFDLEMQWQDGKGNGTEDLRRMDPAYFGLGTQRPLRKFGFRIRRRRRGESEVV